MSHIWFWSSCVTWINEDLNVFTCQLCDGWFEMEWAGRQADGQYEKLMHSLLSSTVHITTHLQWGLAWLLNLYLLSHHPRKTRFGLPIVGRRMAKKVMEKRQRCRAKCEASVWFPFSAWIKLVCAENPFRWAYCLSLKKKWKALCCIATSVHFPSLMQWWRFLSSEEPQGPWNGVIWAIQ